MDNVYYFVGKGVIIILGLALCGVLALVALYFLVELISFIDDKLQNKRRLLRKVRKLDQNIDKFSDSKIHHYLASIYEILNTLYGRSTTSENDGYGYYEDKTDYHEFPETWVECKGILHDYRYSKADLSNLKEDARKACKILLN